MEEERLAEEKRKKQRAGESEYQELFLEGVEVPGRKYQFEERGEIRESSKWHAGGAQFNPTKRFGTIDDEGTLLYEDVTTSYPAYMPTENYQKYIMDKMPKKEDGAGKWFIRPHHLETLTRHPKSIQDDVLNTRYVSHYNQQHGKKEEVNESQVCIDKIESHLEDLKKKQYYLMTQMGQDPDDLEEIKYKTERQGLREYEAFIQDKKRFDSKQLLIQAYEDLLTSQRQTERDALNRTRQIEYDKNRPPQDGWYELKTAGF